MARLLKSQKEDIVNCVVKDTLRARRDKLKNDKEDFASLVYESVLTKEMRNYIAKAPEATYFPHSTNMYVKLLSASYEGRDLTLKNAKPFPYFLYQSQTEAFDSLPEETKARLFSLNADLVERQKAIDKDQRELRAKTRGVLNSVTTEKKLLEVWPEAIKYMTSPEVTSNLPQVTSSELNDLITIFENLEK